MTVKRFELAPGVVFYPHADRVVWTEKSMSWPLPLSDGAHCVLHDFALRQENPDLRGALFHLLSVDAAYAQMTLTDPATKRNHVCSMLRKAARVPSSSEGGER